MTVSDATIEAEGLKVFFTGVGGKTNIFGKKVTNNSLRALEIASKIESAAVTWSPKAALAYGPELIKFATTGEGIKVPQNGWSLHLGIKKNFLLA